MTHESGAGFRAVKAGDFRRLLARELGCRAVPRRGKGDHEVLEASGRPTLVWGFGRRELSPVEVRSVLVNDVGPTLEEAKQVASRV